MFCKKNENNILKNNIDIFNIDTNVENINNLETENIKLINDEKIERDIFIDKLNSDYDIVLVGSGPSLDYRITREKIKKKFKNSIKNNFYIIPINSNWIYCDEYDFCFSNDEHIIYHYGMYNNTNKKMITIAYLWRNPNILNSIPYFYYKKQINNILCMYYNNDDCYFRKRKLKNYTFQNNFDNLIKLDIRNDTCGSTAIKFFSKLKFKNFFLIGFGGTGNTKLTSKIKKANELIKYTPNKNRNLNKEYEKIYKSIEKKHNINIIYI